MDHLLAWHFIDKDHKTGQGGLVVKVGETLSHDGPIRLCASGLHACEDILDALMYGPYGPGTLLCRVEVWGDIEHGSDKLVARNRKCIWMRDVGEDLREFADWCAEEAIKLTSAPKPPGASDGDWNIAKTAAIAAARAARQDAAWLASKSAARVAAWAAARDLKEVARVAAAIHAAKTADQWPASGAANWTAARDAAWDRQRDKLLEIVTREA